MHDPSETVVAVATPAGRGGLGCVRLSGARALELGRVLHRPHDAAAKTTPGGRPVFGRFLDRRARPLDHVVHGNLVIVPLLAISPALLRDLPLLVRESLSFLEAA